MSARTYGGHERRFHWNWLDTLLCIMLALAVLGGVIAFRYWRGRVDGEEGVITYTILLSGVEAELMGGRGGEMPFAIGSGVKTQNGTAEMGGIIELSRTPHRTFAVSNGQEVWVDETGKYDYYVTVQAAAKRSAGDGIRVGDIRIGAGMHLSLRLGSFFAKDAQVISVRWERERDA